MPGKDTDLYMPQKLADDLFASLREDNLTQEAQDQIAADLLAWLNKHWAMNINACPKCDGWAITRG